MKKLKKEGFKADLARSVIKFPKQRIDEALEKVPNSVNIYSRDLKTRIELASETYFTPSGTGIAVFDPESNKRRKSTSEDVQKLVKLQDYLPNVDIARPIITANDYPDYSGVIEFYEAFKGTTKPILHRTLRRDNAKYVIQMAKTIAGDDNILKEKPIFLVIYCSTSPLAFPGENILNMLAYAEHRIPIVVAPMPMGGASAPVSTIGEIIILNAEVLAGLTIIQTFYPGAPVLYGSVASVLDMKTATLSLGAPERAILHRIVSEIANFYGIPSVLGGLSTDSKELDAQNGFEKAITALLLMGKANVIFGMGLMDSANTYSYQQLILDNEFAGYLRKVSAGLPTDVSFENEIDLIKDLQFEGNYLTHANTLKHCKEYWTPNFFTRERYDCWESKKITLEDQLTHKVREILKNHKAEPLPVNILKKLKHIINLP